MTREELEALDVEELDEMVHDLKGEEAAAINNAGKEAQIEYILGLEGCPETLTLEQWAAYKADFTRCLFCGNADIDGGSWEFYGGGPSQKITCNNCGGTWFDDYKFIGVSGIELPDPDERAGL